MIGCKWRLSCDNNKTSGSTLYEGVKLKLICVKLILGAGIVFDDFFLIFGGFVFDAVGGFVVDVVGGFVVDVVGGFVFVVDVVDFVVDVVDFVVDVDVDVVVDVVLT